MQVDLSNLLFVEVLTGFASVFPVSLALAAVWRMLRLFLPLILPAVGFLLGEYGLDGSIYLAQNLVAMAAEQPPSMLGGAAAGLAPLVWWLAVGNRR